jgi:hypothetical protein
VFQKWLRTYTRKPCEREKNGLTADVGTSAEGDRNNQAKMDANMAKLEANREKADAD